MAATNEIVVNRNLPDHSGELATTKDSGEDGSISVLSEADELPFVLGKVHAHFGGSVPDALTIKLDSRHGAPFDTVIFSGVPGTDLYFVPDSKDHFGPGDRIEVTCANSGDEAWAVAIERLLTMRKIN